MTGNGNGNGTGRKKKKREKKKSNQHADFPSGHPPEYYPRQKLLNFIDRTGYGAVSFVWPITTYKHIQTTYKLQTQHIQHHQKHNTTTLEHYHDIEHTPHISLFIG